MRILFFVILLAGLIPWGGSVSAFAASSHTILIENMKFVPDELTLVRGDSVTWVNKDLVPHTITAEDNSFDSKSIAPGGTWKFRLRKTGKIPYKCLFHPTMKAVLVVR